MQITADTRKRSEQIKKGKVLGLVVLLDRGLEQVEMTLKLIDNTNLSSMTVEVKESNSRGEAILSFFCVSTSPSLIPSHKEAGM